MKQFGNMYALCTNKERKHELKGGAFGITLEQARELNEQGYCIFWTPNGFDFGKRSREDLKYINCFYADLDSGSLKDMQKKIIQYPEPSSIIQTGKGYHLYWWLKKELEVTDPEKGCDWFRSFLMDRIVPALNSDSQAADACRLLRTPFYRYWKDGVGDKHIDIVWESDRFYETSYLEKFFPMVKKPTPKIISYPKREGGEDFWTKANRIDCRYALERLSGSSSVSCETFSFKRESSVTRIIINGKTSNAWLDKNGRIGSVINFRGIPVAGSIVNWLTFYGHDMKKIADILKETFGELNESPQNQYASP